jgi:hypothetical protein
VASVDLKLDQGEVHVHLGHEQMSTGPARNVERLASCTIIRPSDSGGIWTPANTGRSCMPDRPVPNVMSMECEW